MIIKSGASDLKANNQQLWPLSTDSDILETATSWLPLESTGLTNHQIADAIRVCSICVSGGLLTSIYNRGRHERFHAPLAIAACATSIAISLATRTQLDILVFVIFPWILAAALFVSRTYSSPRPTVLNSCILAECWQEKNGHLSSSDLKASY